MTAKKMVRNIEPDDPMLQYSGRIDDDDPKAPVLIYAASWVKMIFTGTSVAVTLANHHAYWTNEMGYLLDGVQGRIRLLNDGKKKTYEIAEQLPDARHELMLFKRMDACHTVTFYGFTVDDGADLLPPEPKPARGWKCLVTVSRAARCRRRSTMSEKRIRCTTDSIPTAGIPMPG